MVLVEMGGDGDVHVVEVEVDADVHLEVEFRMVSDSASCDEFRMVSDGASCDELAAQWDTGPSGLMEEGSCTL